MQNAFSPPFSKGDGDSSIISYIGIREMGYKGFEIGRELNMGAGGVSLALRRGESILRERVGIKEEILQKLVK